MITLLCSALAWQHLCCRRLGIGIRLSSSAPGLVLPSCDDAGKQVHVTMPGSRLSRPVGYCRNSGVHDGHCFVVCMYRAQLKSKGPVTPGPQIITNLLHASTCAQTTDKNSTWRPALERVCIGSHRGTDTSSFWCTQWTTLSDTESQTSPESFSGSMAFMG